MKRFCASSLTFALSALTNRFFCSTWLRTLLLNWKIYFQDNTRESGSVSMMKHWSEFNGILTLCKLIDCGSWLWFSAPFSSFFTLMSLQNSKLTMKTSLSFELVSEELLSEVMKNEKKCHELSSNLNKPSCWVIQPKLITLSLKYVISHNNTRRRPQTLQKSIENFAQNLLT